MVDVQEGFDQMAKIFNKEQALKMKKVVTQYVIGGPGGGKWQVVVENGAYTLTPGETIKPVSCTLTYDSVDSFVKIQKGEIGGFKAYTTGKIKISGPRALIQEYGKCFPAKD